ncbi:MAG: ComEA family DNA-binding protein [Rhodanobacteraceae bacterium]
MNFLQKTIVALTLAFACMLPAVAANPVDINSADAKTLAENLHGVGLGKAEAIVAYRTAHGPFKNAGQLSRVKGIGPKTIAKNRDVIMIGKSTPERVDNHESELPVAGQRRSDERRPILRADS